MQVASCTTAFHVTCAIKHKLRMDYKQDGKGRVLRQSYCFKHRFYQLDRETVAKRKASEGTSRNPLSPMLLSAVAAGEFCDFVNLTDGGSCLALGRSLGNSTPRWPACSRRVCVAKLAGL